MGWMNWLGKRPRAARRVATVALGLAIGVLGVATSLPGAAQLTGRLSDGISNSKHNLGSGGPGTVKLGIGQSTEVCVFCHTPHGSDTTASAPLWNRISPAASTFTTYNSTRLQGGNASQSGQAYAPGAVSLACLSCHDGVTAINSVINAPGSGGWNPTQAEPVLFGPVTALTMPAGITNIGQNLNNDHPIGVKYAGGATTANATATFTANGFAAWSTQTINGQPAFWVDTEYSGGARAGNGTRQKTDMWLYTRTDTGLTDTAFVECASCHDPHAVENGTFLRIRNDYSSVCLACHIK